MLRTQKWELHCQISEIKDVGKNHFKISHQSPDELGDEKHWGYRKDATLFLSRQEALSLQPGDYVIYSGTPRFSEGSAALEDDFFSRYFAHNSSAVKHVIRLTAIKIRIQRAGESKAGGEIKSP
jgi:hypothetical protein